jgi:Spy/CpxP family protein refolding chaperone
LTKRTILSLLVAIPLAGPALAQAPPENQGPPGQGQPGGRPPGPPRGPRIEDQLTRLRERLSLTDAQASKIEAILRSSAEEGRADRESNMPREDRMKRGRERMEKTDAAIDALLTAEQKPKFAEMKNERAERMRNRPGGPGGPDGPGGPPPGEGGPGSRKPGQGQPPSDQEPPPPPPDH